MFGAGKLESQAQQMAHSRSHLADIHGSGWQYWEACVEWNCSITRQSMKILYRCFRHSVVADSCYYLLFITNSCLMTSKESALFARMQGIKRTCANVVISKFLIEIIMQKFIITRGGIFRYQNVRMHKDLLQSDDMCIGGASMSSIMCPIAYFFMAGPMISVHLNGKMLISSKCLPHSED